MAQENILKFEQLLQSDEALQAKLAKAADAYAGDKTDERAFFDAVVAPIAEEAGLPHTFDEVVALKDSHELDDAELDAVAGGEGFCFILGGSNRVEKGCDDRVGYACAYVGVGFIVLHEGKPENKGLITVK